MNDGTRYRPTTSLRLTLTRAERLAVDAAEARLAWVKAQQAAERAALRAAKSHTRNGGR